MSSHTSTGIAGPSVVICLLAEALPGDLQWQKEALLKAAQRAVVGCDERAWPAAAPAACALAVALEGKNSGTSCASVPWLHAVLMQCNACAAISMTCNLLLGFEVLINVDWSNI